MTDESDDLNYLIEAAAAEYEADIYFYSGPIDDNGFGQITSSLTLGKQRDRALLILVTNGGLANSAYQIARLFQSQYKEFVLFCPSRCKSAGTLIALGAHRLIMDVFGELGPLDVQLIKQDEIVSRKSGLLAKSSFESLGEVAFETYEALMIRITLKSSGNVSFKVASELAANMASTLLAPVYAQINPEIVGSEKRDLSIAFDYGVRLIKAAKNASVETVDQLVNGYPSHDFIIDVGETRELFRNVEEPTENLYKIIGALGDYAYDEAPSAIACVLTSSPDGANENERPEQAPGEVPSQSGGSGQSELDGGGERDRESDSQSSAQVRSGAKALIELHRPRSAKGEA